ncbi:MAG: sugar-binding protein, partial [Candidatus Kryptoniota bacterium]
MRTLLWHMTYAIIIYIPLSANASVDSTNQTRYIIKAIKINGNIKLDGSLSDPQWKLAQGVTLDYEVQPGNDLPAKQKSTVLVLYNTEYLYLAFICHDTDPSQIRAHVTDRDNIFDDDFVGIILDTYTDHQKAYEFFANPYGVQGDLMRTGNNEDPNFDAVWNSAGAVNDSGYIVEMALPFKSLRFPALKVQNWSMDFLRNLPRESRYQYSWVKLNLNDPCLLCQGGILEGLMDLQATADVELLPYVMGFKADNINDDTNPNSGFTNGDIQGRVGLGLKYSPNPSLGIEGVANPDFSQVESDATQISVNTTSALFYAEKRPFFMEGNDLLTTSIQSYYSRIINNPLGAAKVIQRSGNLSLGYLAAEDRNSPFIVAGEEGSVTDNNGNTTISSLYRSFSNILRAKYDLGTQSFLGVLGTARDFVGAHNYVAGPDWNLFFGGNYTFDGQFLFSNTRELNDTGIISDTAHFGPTRFTKA